MVDMCEFHKCPGPECREQIFYDQLACLNHWRQLTPDIRRMVRRTWRNGRGGHTQAHRNAMRLALADMRPLYR